ncbi:MAG: HEPN domain-containing protein [Bacteroidetes bacterium]|nr:HEPN domain-containing protein [Bacteroidota bacterium]MBU1679643.1 HEPN domain-containing protein [Bacteroidota bacterium]MBU2507390.1 HEPN domain-containing protein [Bacteroidota bacterium]
MNKEEYVKYWVDAADLDYRAMKNLFLSGDYVWSLFIGHLVVEKIIKAIAVKNDAKDVPKIHDLNKLSRSTGLSVDDKLSDLFDIITSFNIETRYPDYKKEFYKKCNLEFASEQNNKINELRIWLLDQLNR